MGIFGEPGGFQIVVLEYMPLRRFGLFQILLSGWPIGDGTTTALYPHYCDLQDLARLVESGEPHERSHLILGDTFDHMQIDAEMTDCAILFSFRSHDENSQWREAQVDSREFLSVWRQAAACIEAILARADES
ncbi:hypothetical protein EES39_19495 [Streptomyces sp. ADI92-24]|uniref:hypothetical protein n=1 Tax=Streptomyces sp. ADI92-24 TaxID=1522756 RepID=UPI000F557307|nr:hypothetical protein [Streptomyces sp. ADI92-24]RPK43305.1 hypothetical protein EES39_19495 [Streptomyces sp. ADI92-24]